MIIPPSCGAGAPCIHHPATHSGFLQQGGEQAVTGTCEDLSDNRWTLWPGNTGHLAGPVPAIFPTATGLPQDPRGAHQRQEDAGSSLLLHPSLLSYIWTKVNRMFLHCLTMTKNISIIINLWLWVTQKNRGTQMPDTCLFLGT